MIVTIYVNHKYVKQILIITFVIVNGRNFCDPLSVIFDNQSLDSFEKNIQC